MDIRELIAEDARLTVRAGYLTFEEFWPECRDFLSKCVGVAPHLRPSDRRIVRSILQFWATYQYRHTGDYESPAPI